MYLLCAGALRSQDRARLIAENLGNSYELKETLAVSLHLERIKYSLNGAVE